MHELYNVKFDVDKIIGHFGSVSNAAKALQAIGLHVKAKTLQKQRERGNMTADTIASLALASVRLKNQLDLYECLIVRTEWSNQEGEEQTCTDLNTQAGTTQPVG